MNQKTYWQKLKDPRWQKLRLQVMEANNFCCEMCGDSESTLNVHHKEYLKGHEPWEYETNQLSVLCESCHDCVHEEFNFLRWVCSQAPLDGPANRTEIAFLIAGFIGISFDTIISTTELSPINHWERIYKAGKDANLHGSR